MTTSRHGNSFRVIGPLWKESTSQRTGKAGFDDLFVVSLNKQFEQTLELPVFWHAVRMILWRQCIIFLQNTQRPMPKMRFVCHPPSPANPRVTSIGQGYGRLSNVLPQEFRNQGTYPMMLDFLKRFHFIHNCFKYWLTGNSAVWADSLLKVTQTETSGCTILFRVV